MKRFLRNVEIALAVLVLGLLVVIALPNQPLINTGNIKTRKTIANTYEIQMALERFIVDNHVYPDSIGALIDRGYIHYLPRNAFRMAEGKYMAAVSMSSSNFLGNFSYIPIAHEGEITEYILCSYAPSHGERVKKDDPAWSHMAVCLHGTMEGTHSPLPGGSWEEGGH